jgi:hypothetical protein
MGYPNKLLVDCFLKYHDQYLFIKRKNTEKWFPGWYGSLWREVPPHENPRQTLLQLFKECKVRPRKITLEAIANNVFHDLQETFNVFLFIVEVDKKPTLHVPEGEEVIWLTQKQMNKQVLLEYRKIFPRFSKDILFYHTEYDADKLLKIEFF